MTILPSVAERTLFLVLIGACASEPTGSTLPLFVPARDRQTPQARVTYADSVNVGSESTPTWMPAGYRGDGRIRNGDPGSAELSNEYQGSFCGVNANIGTGLNGQTTQFTFDPDQNWSATLPGSCHPARSVAIYVNGPTQPPAFSRQHRYFPSLGSMAAGDTLIKPWNDGTGAELGVNLWFDGAYPPASSPRWIRLPNVLDEFGRSVRQWRIETQGSHRAMGFVKGPGKQAGLVPTGITYYLPFTLTITEVPPPFPTLP